jgi:hypothetical protein
LAAEQAVRFVVADATFLLAVPFEGATQLEREHAEQAESCRSTADFDVADRPRLPLDGLQEVGPEFGNVLSIGLVQFRGGKFVGSAPRAVGQNVLPSPRQPMCIVPCVP